MSQQISSKNIQELRNKTGAGMMDCKKALVASDNNIDIAIEYLRKKGLAKADKKSSRIATEGIIHSYIHAGSKIGVILELNCETDFVAREMKFIELAKNISMQIAAYQSIEYVCVDDIPDHIILSEKNIESKKEDLINKPKEIQEKIINARIEKKLKEMSLMDQSFMRNSDISIEELVKQHISLLGENIKIRRFVRFILGEGLDNKSNNFAQEVSQMIYNN
uniref:Elongation factor Ts, mitochondrial n=1 Tax=Haraldiophyllum bonnemaisonii TaxID=167977 RepID=A0A4D6WU97_9FLOR|nr:Translation elongation factor Ts [Haraldiophyllum bonnemaisonii]